MKKIKTYIAMALTGVLMLSFVGCNMIERTPESIKKTVLAKVGSEKITRGDLDKVMQPTLDALKQKYGDDFENNADIKDQLKEERKNQLSALVDEKVLLQKAKDLGVNPTEDELKKDVDDRIEMFKKSAGTEEQYQSFIKSYGYDEDGFREFLKNQALVGKVVDAIVADAQVSDDDISTYYNENISSYQKGPGADAYNIFVKDEETANKIRGQISNLEDFKKLAGEYNTDATKDKGGSLGYVTYENNGMVQEFTDAFKKLGEGELSPATHSSLDGWHLIMATNVHKDAYTQPLDSVKSDIKDNLLKQKQQDLYKQKLEEFKKEINVKTYEDKL